MVDRLVERDLVAVVLRGDCVRKGWTKGQLEVYGLFHSSWLFGQTKCHKLDFGVIEAFLGSITPFFYAQASGLQDDARLGQALVIAAPAIGLEFAIEKLRTILETDSFVINVLTFLKYAILILDALLVLIFLSIQAYKFVREIAA